MFLWILRNGLNKTGRWFKQLQQNCKIFYRNKRVSKIRWGYGWTSLHVFIHNNLWMEVGYKVFIVDCKIKKKLDLNLVHVTVTNNSYKIASA